MTNKQHAFMQASHISSAVLIGAVIEQVGGWDSFVELAEDVTNHGAGGGFSGFIYYHDTVPFAQANRRAIIDMAKAQADDMGAPGAYSLIAGFQCLQLTTDEVADALLQAEDDNHTQVMNALAWYALEEVCRSYVDLADGGDLDTEEDEEDE